MCRRGQAWRSSPPYSYWLRITVGSSLPARATRRLLLESGGYRARNHAALGHIDSVVGHGAQKYRCRVPGSISSGLTTTLREDWSGKQALETPCHTSPLAHRIPRTMSLGQRSQMWHRTPFSRGDYISRSKDWLDNATVHPSARPEVRGTAGVDVGAYLPFLPPPRTPSRLSSFWSTDERTGTDRTLIERGRCLCTILRAVCGEGGGVCHGPVRPPHSASSVNYHLLGWWSTT